jgi:hypothetical protein
LAEDSIVWEVLNPTEELKAPGQDITGRTWVMLTIVRHAILHCCTANWEAGNRDGDDSR